MAGFGSNSQDALAQRAPTMASPLSYMRPTTPYGETYTPSYTSFQNAPGSSYVNPLHDLFNDRRPPPAAPRSTLTPTRSPAAAPMGL